MPSSKALKAGDRVAVPWGLDTREGEVVSVYQTGAVERVVIRLAVPEGAGDDSPTVVLPADAVEPLPEDATLPTAGNWLHGYRYERAVADALARVTTEWSPTIRLNAEYSGREVDIALETEQSVLVVEVKTAEPLPERSFDAALRQLRSTMNLFPKSKGLLVTQSALPASVRKTAGARGLLSPNLGAVRWKSPEDDKRLDRVVHSLLSGALPGSEPAEG